MPVRPEAYFDAASQSLAAGGFRSVTIAGLCDALGVTTGSFYHHFGSWDGFVAAFLAHWEWEQTQRVVHLAESHQAHERVGFLASQAREMPHATEAAIRAWADNDDTVAAAQRRVDGLRLGALSAAVEALVDDPAVARRLAALGVAALIGIEQLHNQLSREERGDVIDIVRCAIEEAAALAASRRPR